MGTKCELSLIILVVFLFMPSFGYASTSSDMPWQAQMQKLYQALAALLNDVSSDARFYDTRYKHQIEQEASTLANLAHGLNTKNKPATGSDPTIDIVATMLKGQADSAVFELKHGNRIYARSLLRVLPSYCIACHTRNETGPQFSKLNFEPGSSLGDFDRGEFFTATRQFDRALLEFKKVVENPLGSGTTSVVWRKAIQESLAIAVRVKQDPIAAKQIVQTIIHAENAPDFIREDAKSWNRSIEAWQAEKGSLPPSEESLFAQAKQLLATAREMQKFPMDRNADVYYWRASAAIHDLLQLAPSGVHSDEALLLAGLSYEVLNPLELSDLHEIFYETCIRKAPHSITAKTCFDRLESSLLSGYTGASGTDISQNMLARLKELRELSRTK